MTDRFNDFIKTSYNFSDLELLSNMWSQINKTLTFLGHLVGPRYYYYYYYYCLDIATFKLTDLLGIMS